MKSLTQIKWVVPALLFLVTSCAPQEPMTHNEEGSLSFAADGPEDHPGPAPQCTPSIVYDLVNNQGSAWAPPTQSGTKYGTVEVTNDPDAVWVIGVAQQGWVFSNARMWCGSPGTCPIVDGPAIAPSAFGDNLQLTPSRAVVMLDAPQTPGVPRTVDLVVNFTAHRLNGFAQPVFVTNLWAGAPYYNGYRIANYQFMPCGANEPDPPVVAVSSTCTTVLTGLPSSVNGGSTCATVSTVVTGGTAPFTYVWSTGATTSSITACPGSTTTYSVTVTDALGATSSGSVTVQAINIRCGNSNGNNGAHKVMVCHLPPGNPANQQDICIDWSGVPAHVAAYRPATYNPNMGHDSGCYLGPCGNTACGAD